MTRALCVQRPATPAAQRTRGKRKRGRNRSGTQERTRSCADETTTITTEGMSLGPNRDKSVSGALRDATRRTDGRKDLHSAVRPLLPTDRERMVTASRGLAAGSCAPIRTDTHRCAARGRTGGRARRRRGRRDLRRKPSWRDRHAAGHARRGRVHRSAVRDEEDPGPVVGDAVAGIDGLARAKRSRAFVMAAPIDVSPPAVSAGGSNSAVVVNGCSTCAGPRVTMASSTRLLVSVSAARSSRGDWSPRSNSLIGARAIELDTSSSSAHGQRGSRLVAKLLASKKSVRRQARSCGGSWARWMRSGSTRQAARCGGARRHTGFLREDAVVGRARSRGGGLPSLTRIFQCGICADACASQVAREGEAGVSRRMRRAG